MIKFFLLIIFFILNLYAKDDFTIDTSYYLTKEKLTLNQIKQINDFIPSKGENLSIVNQNVWLKIDIKNNSEQDLSRIFKFTFPYMDDITIYQDGKIEKYGRTNNYNIKMLSIDNNVFKVKLNALEEKIVFINITTSYAVKTFMENFNEDDYIHDLFFKKSLFYFCYGIIFSLIFYNFFIWYSTRKKEFLYYVLFHSSLLAGIVSWSGFGFQYIWPNFPEFNYYSYGIIVNLIIGYQILYVVYYLDTDQYLPKFTSFLKLFSKILFFFALISPLFELTLLYELGSVFSTLSLLGTTIYLALVKKSTLAFYIFASELLLITGNFFMLMSDMGIIQGSFVTDYFYVFGASVEVILMSFALSYKYNELERQQAIESQKRIKTEQMLIDKQKLTSIGENFNHLVHQFRQPLSQINSVVYLLYSSFKTGKLNDDIMETNLNNIESQTTYLSKTLEYFRNFTSQEEKKEIFQLLNFIEEVKTIMEFIVKKHNISLQIDFNKNVTLNTNKTQLLQIMSIIITNAKDAFIENNTQEPQIVLKIYEENSILNFTISNNAGTIDHSIEDKIFDPYFTTKKKTEGTGLGLYIAKLIVEERLNSSIFIQTDKEWTTFLIKLQGVLVNYPNP